MKLFERSLSRGRKAIFKVYGPPRPKKKTLVYHIDHDCYMKFAKYKSMSISPTMDLIVKKDSQYSIVVPEGHWYFMVRQIKPKRNSGEIKLFEVEDD